MKGVIREGDATGHGGKVLQTSGFMKVDGKGVAVVGDPCSCPQPGHGNCAIAEGDPKFTLNGKAVAFHGHKTSCGATLTASTERLLK